MTDRVGRNDPCPCGSGKKYKQCCLLNKQPATGPRKFKAKIISAGGMPKPQASESQQQPSQAFVDYNTLMERSFGNAIHSTEEKPPLPDDPFQYLPKKGTSESDK